MENDDRMADVLRKIYLRCPKSLTSEERVVIRRIFSYSSPQASDEEKIRNQNAGKLDWALSGQDDRDTVRNAWRRINVPLTPIKRNMSGDIIQG